MARAIVHGVRARGTSAQGALPAWVPGAGKFATVSLANASTVDPDPDNSEEYAGVEGFSAIWRDWNTGVYAPTLGALGSMLFFGGGHWGYYGNCVVRYDLYSRGWSLLSQPSTAAVDLLAIDGDPTNTYVSTQGAYSDGTPYPAHTNCAAVFLPPEAGGGTLGSYVFQNHDQTGVNITSGALFRFDLALAMDGQPASACWSKWNHRNLGVEASPDLMGMVYDPYRKGMWLLASGNGFNACRLYFLNWATQTRVEVDINSAGGNVGLITYFPATVLVENRDCLVLTRSSAGLYCIDLSGIDSTPANGDIAAGHTITQSGTACPSLWTYPSGGAPGGSEYLNQAGIDHPAYCSLDGNLYALNTRASSGCSLYKLTVPATLTDAWVWSNETLTAQSGETLALDIQPYPESNDHGLVGRFRYIPRVSSFFLSDAHNKPAQLLRPAAFT